MMHRWLPSKTSTRSRVGQKLSDLTTQKVIVGILTLLLIIPVFNIYSGLYGTYSPLDQGGLQMLHDLYLDVSGPLARIGFKKGERFETGRRAQA